MREGGTCGRGSESPEAVHGVWSCLALFETFCSVSVDRGSSQHDVLACSLRDSHLIQTDPLVHRTHNANEIMPEIALHNGNPNDHDYIAWAAAAAQLDHPSEIHDRIAQQMWEDYVCVCNERGLDRDDQLGDEDQSGDENLEGWDDGDDLEDNA